MAAKTKNYILKKGMKMSYVEGGVAKKTVGDGKGTVALTEDQAAAFKDKLSGEAAEAIEIAPAIIDPSLDPAAAEEKAGGSTTSEAAAKAAAEDKDDKDDKKPADAKK